MTQFAITMWADGYILNDQEKEEWQSDSPPQP